MKIFILILYFVLILCFIIFCLKLRKKIISKAVKVNNYTVLNKRYCLRVFLIILNVALAIGVIGVFISEDNLLFMSLDILVTMFVNFVLLYLLFLYPIMGSLIYVNNGDDSKVYLVYKGDAMEFEYIRVHFERKKHKTLMYYKDSLVLTTNQSIKNIKPNK